MGLYSGLSALLMPERDSTPVSWVLAFQVLPTAERLAILMVPLVLPPAVGVSDRRTCRMLDQL